MKYELLLLLGSLSVGQALPVSEAAGTFRNLDFETARLTLPPIQPGVPNHNVPIQRALPNWTAFVGTMPLSAVWYNDVTVGSANVDLIDRYSFLGELVIDGDYSVVLQPGIRGAERVNASISQFGVVPAEAESIQFKCTPFPFSLSFAGQELPIVPLAVQADYTLYGADIAPFAGQSGQLTITAIRDGIVLDSLVFSPDPVPEPRVAVLLGVGLLVLTYSLMRHRPPRASSGKTSNAPTPPALKFPDGFERERAANK